MEAKERRSGIHTQVETVPEDEAVARVNSCSLERRHQYIGGAGGSCRRSGAVVPAGQGAVSIELVT